MDLFDILLNVGLVTTGLVAYLIIFKRSKPSTIKGNYREPSWNFQLRLFSAKRAIKRWKASLTKGVLEETPRPGQNEGWDCIGFTTSSTDGAVLLLSLRKVYAQPAFAEVTVHVKLSDGTTYKLAQHPETAVETWKGIKGGWSAGGLKIEVLEPQTRLRIIFNGLLTRLGDNVTQHVRFNFLWASATIVVRHPEDWSEDLAARALALEPWRDERWPQILDKTGGGSWVQWGAVQGRFQSYNDGVVDKSEYLETRGVKERSWSPQGYSGLRRSVNITAAARDGTCVQLQGFSYKDTLTMVYNGSIRFPDHSCKSISRTNLVMSEFGEHPDNVPTSHIFNVSTNKRDLTVVLRTNADGGTLLSGTQSTVYRTIAVEINGEPGTGLLQLGYERKAQPVRSLPPAPSLVWLSEKEAGEVTYCVPFEARAAMCPGYVGGKGASLALLASVQKEQGYRVPPGYCISIKALEKQLEANPEITAAIKGIEAANVDYDENNFKDKCAMAVEILTTTKLVSEVRDEVITHLKDLREKALLQNYGPKLRFAVRSSAVGEDSEALSAAGQNESILGCVSDDDVIQAVLKCWASMFAFTSAHYRRQNGQQCLCGGAVVVQVLSPARAAGVMFTTHPEAGDPSRLLITANYGLGESVVSGSVEPDTIILSRNNELSISKIELGSKKQRITAIGSGVSAEDVPESERSTPCVSVSEALALGKIGVAQEEMWGAPRDIEWAIVDGEIFLLQARPVTSLERWTEEELLHEMDTPIMSDDELTTFANTGEVLPKPVTALNYDLVVMPLLIGTYECIYAGNYDYYDKALFITHQRTVIALYNSLYRLVPGGKVDFSIRMLDMSIQGRVVADDHVMEVAMHRKKPSRWMQALIMYYTAKYYFTANRLMKDTIKRVTNMKLDTESTDPLKILKVMEDQTGLMAECSLNHSVTSTASTTAQLIAMMILAEGAEEFTTQHCSDVNILLSAGDVVSAEVPQALAKLARQLDQSDKVEEFRSLNPKEAMDWLSVNIPDVYKNICSFLEEHGHRAVMEFDIATKPWALVPEQMIEVLQNMRPKEGSEVAQSSRSTTDILKELKTPKKPLTRRLLGWIMPQCGRTVQRREVTKAHLILGVHKLRLAARRLGKLLVQNWYLPDEELVFHFRLQELREYILTRDPSLLRKASQRHQYHDSWCKLKFSELNTGWVRPQRTRGPRVTAGGVKISATAACGGEIIGRACVIKNLSEIGQLQRGDILITHSTDIGWSPYFPLIAGIVTELGGLISHGAVIAREYGLPCLIGATDATDLFKTGDMVRLSSYNGTLEKVSVDKSDDDVTPNDTRAEKL